MKISQFKLDSSAGELIESQINFSPSFRAVLHASSVQALGKSGDKDEKLFGFTDEFFC